MALDSNQNGDALRHKDDSDCEDDQKAENNAKEMENSSNGINEINENAEHHPTEEELESAHTEDEISIVLSIVYGLLIVILAIVFKVSEYIIQRPHLVSKEYYIMLYSIALLWLIVFRLGLYWRHRNHECARIVKSPHASNRWLKGVIGLFGFAIIIKDSLEEIGVSEVANPLCKQKVVYSFRAAFHALFVLGQVIFLFFYAKIHIMEFQALSRFGVMHALSTNLAVWIGVIADETSHALEPGTNPDYSVPNPVREALSNNSHAVLYKYIETHCSNTSILYNYLNPVTEASVGEVQMPTITYDNTTDYYAADSLFREPCKCTTPVCTVIARAERFLSPLLIEFCLVSSCLLYFIWRRIGKPVRHHRSVPVPSHKFYKCYKGVMVGALMLVATVIVMTLLGTLDRKVYPTLTIHDGFLLGCNLTLLLACILAFYVYSIAKIRRHDSSLGLDEVLLFICMNGPLLVSIFSILALSAGPEESKPDGWVVSLWFSITDIIVSIVQVLLIVHGLNRESASERQSEPENICSRLINKPATVNYQAPVELKSIRNVNSEGETQNTIDLGGSRRAETSLNSTVISNWNVEEEGQSVQRNTTALAVTRPPELNPNLCDSCATGDVKRKSTTPPEIRLILREIIMFLVLCNTCLWVFMSLNGTVFKVYSYADKYFGHSAWATLVSVTAPLSIFLKLHFAACYFEIWSYS